MITVVICTHNRAQLLKACLASMERLVVPSDMSLEILVVDNNSGDETKWVVQEASSGSRVRLRYLFEGRQGLSYARNTGVKAANGEVVAFTDDDCVVDRQWIVGIAGEFERDERIGVVCGRVELFSKADVPLTITASTVRQLFSSPYMLFNGFVHGCNMAFRKCVFSEVGEFDTDLGAGSLCAAAEDSDMFYRVYKHQIPIVYVPQAIIFHNHGRRTVAQAKDIHRNYAVGRGAFYWKYVLRGDIKVMLVAFSEIERLVWSVLRNMFAFGVVRWQLMKIGCLVLGAAYKLGSAVRGCLARRRAASNRRRRSAGIDCGPAGNELVRGRPDSDVVKESRPCPGAGGNHA